MTFAIRSRGLIRSASINKSFFPGNCKTCMLRFTIRIQNAKWFLKKRCMAMAPVPAGRWAGLWPVFWAGRNQASQEHLSSPCVPCGEILPLYPKLGIPGKHFSLTSLSLRSVEAACASITRSLQLLSQFCSCQRSWLSFSSSNCLLFSVYRHIIRIPS